MIIRISQAADEQAIFALARAFATSFVVEERQFSQSFAALLDSADAHVSVAEEDGRIVGYLLGFDHPAFYANGRVSWVEEIMVEESFRRLGVGQQLMQEFETWSVRRGSRLVGLATRRADSFYLALGYQESATYFRKLL